MLTFNLRDDFTDGNAEQSLLAAIAARPELYWELLDLLPAEVLATESAIWQGLAHAIEADQSFEVPTGWQPAADPRATARRLADLHQRRLLAEMQERLAHALYDTNRPATELAALLEEEATRIQHAVRELRAGRVLSLLDLLPDVVQDVQRRREAVQQHGTPVLGLATGIRRLDTLLGGLQPGVHLLAAEPGQGKTTFTLQIAAQIAASGTPVLFVSFEEPVARLALKVICARTGLEAKPYSDGYGDLALFQQAVREQGPRLELLHFIEGAAKLTTPMVRAKALQVMAKCRATRCLVVVDYLQIWAASKRDFTDYRHTVSGLVSELRELSLRLDSPVLVISSQNRSGQGEARLTSLKESGDLEYSADTALFLVDAGSRRAVPPARAVDMMVEKNRYGDKGKIELIFHAAKGTFREEAHP
jgi:replicative DNA helicase